MAGRPELPHVELVARRQADLHGRADYFIYAGLQIVGRIYQQPDGGRWIWSINSITSDATVGERLAGYADSLEEARQNLRNAFERWMTWRLRLKRQTRNMALSIAIPKRSASASLEGHGLLDACSGFGATEPEIA
jgi:hypothetical protein